MNSGKVYRQTQANYNSSVPIPENEGYTVIGAGAFYKTRRYIVTIPEGVEVIEPYAFAGCDELVRVELPSTLKEIGEGAFLGCVQLREMTVPDGVQKIGEFAFWDCGKYVRGGFKLTVPDSVNTVGQNAHEELSARGEVCPRPEFTAKITVRRNGEEKSFTLTELDPYTAKEAVSWGQGRQFALVAVQADTAVIYSFDDKASFVLPLGKTVHIETTHLVGAAYEYTDTVSKFEYVSDYTLTELDGDTVDISTAVGTIRIFEQS